MPGGQVHTAFVGMAGGPVQEEKGVQGGSVQNISDVGGGGRGLCTLCLLRKRHIRVCTTSLRTRDFLTVNNSLHYKKHILFL
jgi:hypothetical protein